MVTDFQPALGYTSLPSSRSHCSPKRCSAQQGTPKIKKEATAMGSLLIHEFDLFNELLPLLLEFL